MKKSNENDKKSDSKDYLANITSKSKWNKEKTKFLEKWKSDWRLREWIEQVINNPNKVSCQFCHVKLRAHKADLYKHASTRKHLKSVNVIRRNAQEAKESDVDVYGENNCEDDSREIVLSTSREYNSNMITKEEKHDEPFVPLIFVEAHENGASYSAEHETDSRNCFIGFSEEETFLPSKSTSDQEISEIVRRVGFVLIKEVTKLLQKDKNILNFFKSHNEDLSTATNINKLTKICIGHLSQRYLVESMVGPVSVKSSVDNREKNDFSHKFTSIQDKLETAVSEMMLLKETSMKHHRSQFQ